MSSRTLSGQLRLRFGSLIAGAAVIMLMAFGLWADTPGPKPDYHVRVASFQPTGLTTTESNITINFTNDLVPTDSLNRPTNSIPVRIEPEIDGLARWTQTDQLTIYPSQRLNPATDYTATVYKLSGFVNDNAIAETEEFEFHTPSLSVELVHYQAQRLSRQGDQLQIALHLRFNFPVERERLLESLRIKGLDEATSSSLEIETNDSVDVELGRTGPQTDFYLVTEPFEHGSRDQRYRLEVLRGLRCVDCGEGLRSDYEFTMQIRRNSVRALYVNEVAAQRAGVNGQIRISMSNRVVTENLKDFISIEPSVPFTIDNYWRGINLRGSFAPQTTYTVTIAPGVMAEDGVLLAKGLKRKIIMGDLEPNISFTSPGIYLPKQGNRFLEVETTNIDTLSIEVYRVFANNLVPYFASNSYRDYSSYGVQYIYGQTFFTKDFPLKDSRNEPLTSTVDIGQIIGDTLQGVFVISARDKTYRWRSDMRTVMITDLGITARQSENHLMVWVHQLSDTEPARKADVKLYSRNNQLILEGKTNNKGVVIFEEIERDLNNFEPYLITVETSDDLSYLRFDNTRMYLSDMDIDGRPYLTDGYEAYLTLNQGVFRPGDTAQLVSMVRGKDGVLPNAFPYIVKIVDPRGRDFREYRLSADQSLSDVTIDLPYDIPTGKYQVTARLGEETVLGQTSFLVEEFMPERMKVEVTTDKASYQLGDTAKYTVTGMMLYGAPASNLGVKSEAVISSQRFAPEGYSGYSFARRVESPPAQKVSLGDGKLGADGTLTGDFVIRLDKRPPAAARATVWSSVSEMGGRAVSSSTSFDIFPYDHYLGIKTTLTSYAELGKPVTSKLVALTGEGTPVALDGVLVRFERVVYNTMLKKLDDGTYQYVSEQTSELLDSARVYVGRDGVEVTFTPAYHGRYEITAIDGRGGHGATTSFYASGWGRVPWSMEKPDRLELDLDKEEYNAGDIATLQVRSPFSGRLLVTVENQTVQDYLVVDMPENTAELELPVNVGYAPNVYVTATLIRPAGEVARHTPARAFGLIPLKVVPKGKRMQVSLSSPEEIRPNSALSVKVQTDGGAGTKITLAAVDAGVLQLTSFEPPDPFGYFYGKRRPALGIFDLYSYIYPEAERASSHLSPAGGASSFREAKHQNPFQARRVKVVSLWSGVVTTDSTGDATVTLSVPQFNGQLEIMAMTVEEDRFGSASVNTLVREPIIIQESFPRFVAPGDSVSGIVTIFNGLDTTATITVTADLIGSATLSTTQPQQITLASNAQGIVRFPFRATHVPGLVDVAIQASAGIESSHVNFEMSNRPAQPLATKYGSGSVAADSSVEFTLPDNWVEGSDNYVIQTSSLNTLQIARNLEFLLKYPYGCVEQTTSRLFPLLYFDKLSEMLRPELIGDEGPEYYLALGIDKLERIQNSDGSFSYWPNSRVHVWSSIYANDFLLSAHKAGYDVDKQTRKRAIRYLKDVARNRDEANVNTEHRIYAGLVLARNGELDSKVWNYLKELNTMELRDFSRYQLAGVMVIMGETELARTLAPNEIQPDISVPETGGCFSSGVRTDAILLDLFMQLEPGSGSCATLARSLIERARIGRWYNTQSTAFALCALGRYFSTIEIGDFTGEISVAGETFQIDTADFRVIREGLGGETVGIEIDGKGPCYYFWQASGVPIEPDTLEYERGIRVTREYLDSSGKPVDLAWVTLGDRLVVHIKVESTRGSLQNVVIADLLPAGLEIENTRLDNTPMMSWAPTKSSRVDYMDMRDDRMLFFVDVNKGRTEHYYYGVRAIATGDFIIPPVMSECMYNPLIAGAGSSGRVMISEEIGQKHGE